MKAAIIGNGFIGNAHRAAFAMFKEEGVDIELVAICDIRPEMLKKNTGERLYTSVDEMLENEKELDFVCLCLPTYLHAEYAIKLMKAGLNVLCEKPMALNMADCERMIECSKETGKRLMVAQCSRFGKDMVIMKEFIEEGSFGIREPKTTLEKYDRSSDAPALMIIPALVYDKYGYRLGYGRRQAYLGL